MPPPLLNQIVKMQLLTPKVTPKDIDLRPGRKNARGGVIWGEKSVPTFSVIPSRMS